MPRQSVIVAVLFAVGVVGLLFKLQHNVVYINDSTDRQTTAKYQNSPTMQAGLDEVEMNQHQQKQEDETEPGRHHLFLNPVEFVPDLLSPGQILKPSPPSKNSSKIASTEMIKQIQIECKDRRRMGHTGDGGWDVCFDLPYNMTKNHCLVYSFGIAGDWSFDDAISKKEGCTVHSFDPSIGKPDHKHSDLVFFHNLGLRGHLGGSGSSSDKFWKAKSHPKWKMDTLQGIRRSLGHQNTTIDYLKIDIEGSERHSFPSMFKDGDLWTVKQLAFELHIPNYNNDTLLALYTQLLQLEVMGFRKFHYHENPRCNRCHEIYYLNTNFITD